MTNATQDRPEAATNADTTTGFPAPEQLATPTDLEHNETRAVTEAVNPLIADTFASRLSPHTAIAVTRFQRQRQLA